MSRSQARATAGPACSVEGHQGLERKCTKLEEENATLRLQLQSLQARNVELGKAGAVYRDVSSLEQDLREHLQNAERKIARLEQFMALVCGIKNYVVKQLRHLISLARIKQKGYIIMRTIIKQY